MTNQFCTPVFLGFDELLLAWKTVGLGVMCIIGPYLYYEREIYAEEFRILSIFGAILTTVFVDNLVKIICLIKQ